MKYDLILGNANVGDKVKLVGHSDLKFVHEDNYDGKHPIASKTSDGYLWVERDKDSIGKEGVIVEVKQNPANDSFSYVVEGITDELKECQPNQLELISPL